MKFLLIGLICINFLQVFSLEKEKEREMAKRLLTLCKKSEGASEADFENLINERMPQSKEGTCMLACVYETAGIVFK